MTQYDLIVIGAGPAGMAMSTECAQSGMRVLLLDDQPAPGGQIYRAVTESRLENATVFNNDYWRGAQLSAGLDCQNIKYVKGARVWYAKPSVEVWYSSDGHSIKATAKYIAIAIGARERPVAISGWTLPGVFSAGAAQVLLKSAGIAADDVVLAGSGPLLYLVAAQYISAGKKIKALLDTTSWSNYQKAMRALPGAIIQGQLYKGLKLLAKIRLAGISVHNGVKDVRIFGDQSVQSISWRKGVKTQELACETVFLHEGLVPNIEFSVALGCDWSWSSVRCAWEIKVNEIWETSLPNVYAIGDCARIVGADVSEIQGRLAGLQLARKANGKEVSEREANLVRQLAKHMRLRRFLDQLYSPSDENLLTLESDTVVCRCENVKIHTLEKLIDKAQGNLNFIKSLTRCGMGPCQGRMCSHSVAVLGRIHQLAGVVPSRQRLPLAPITISELAALEDIE